MDMKDCHRCPICNTTWPESKLNSQGICPYCRGEEDRPMEAQPAPTPKVEPGARVMQLNLFEKEPE